MPQGQDLATQIRTNSLEELAARIASSAVGSQVSEAARAELTRREILATQKAADAQVLAADAQVKNARWVFWSVIAVLFTSFINLAWTVGYEMLLRR
jgi:hypothetical protein